jgi:hypothetical protein
LENLVLAWYFAFALFRASVICAIF